MKRLRGLEIHAASYLPRPEQALIAIRERAEVLAAAERVLAAGADPRALALGEYEPEITLAPQRRRTASEGRFDEWEAALSRRFRFPGKARLDRRGVRWRGARDRIDLEHPARSLKSGGAST